MQYLVTGCAGFIGSHLCRSLIKSGNTVVGIDCFTDYYDRRIKEENVRELLKSEKFTLLKEDLLFTNLLEKILERTDYVFHLSAQPGVRKSWGKDFEIYVNNNILATQKLLECTKKFPIKKFIFASSSSVYGDCKLPMKEDIKAVPISPYGISKLACEHLCNLYSKNFNIPIVCLRYFSVYGPGQRPDMAFYKFIKAILKGEELTIYGDGQQTRDFTYIDDVVDATVLASQSKLQQGVLNIGGGCRIKLNDAVKLLEEIIGRKARIKYVEKQKGDVRDTLADIEKAKELINYNPKYDLKKGLAKEVEWIK